MKSPIGTIELREGTQYGAIVYYPHCEAAQLFCEIAGTKTMKPGTVSILKNAGFAVVVIPKEGRTL